LYCWVEEDLSKQLKEYCIKKKDKKARIVRRALRAFLGDVNGQIKGEGLGVEENVCESSGQPAA
jgi:hypothetical protein